MAYDNVFITVFNTAELSGLIFPEGELVIKIRDITFAYKQAQRLN